MIVKDKINDKWVLEIFEHFHSDRMLPKFNKQQPVASNIATMESKFDDSTPEWGGTPFIVTNVGNSEYEMPVGWRHRLMRTIAKVLGISQTVPKGNYGSIDPLKIFVSVRKSLQEAKEYLDRISLYDVAIQQATLSGQTARVAKLTAAKRVVGCESVLRVAGFNQYLTETQLVLFASKCQKGLALDWAENFVRPIPDAVVKRKVEADSLKVFDNYVVLHYDPAGKAFELTPTQVAAKKDPILFGVIKDVRKLYFIGDWKDDECDLTMSEVESVLGSTSSVIPLDPIVDL